MTLAIVVLMCCAIIILAALGPKPVSWAALALAVIALLLAVMGGFSVHVGR